MSASPDARPTAKRANVNCSEGPTIQCEAFGTFGLVYECVGVFQSCKEQESFKLIAVSLRAEACRKKQGSLNEL